jgi:uncharacterized protein (DUF433 family)
MSGGIALDDEKLIEKWIEPDPWKAGVEEARVKKYGMNVWAIIGYLQMRDGNPERVADAYEIPVEAVQAALACYHRHKGCIDARLRANQGGDAVLGDDPLVAKYIQLDPVWESAAEARIKGHGMSVWAVIGCLRGEGGDIDAVARAYEIPEEAVEAAVAYYRLNQDAIDCRLAANTA